MVRDSSTCKFDNYSSKCAPTHTHSLASEIGIRRFTCPPYSDWYSNALKSPHIRETDRTCRTAKQTCEGAQPVWAAPASAGLQGAPRIAAKRTQSGAKRTRTRTSQIPGPRTHQPYGQDLPGRDDRKNRRAPQQQSSAAPRPWRGTTAHAAAARQQQSSLHLKDDRARFVHHLQRPESRDV
jgi:hypothetical protein